MEIFSKLHPLIVHFPIAAFIIYLLLELISVLMKRYELSLFSFIVLCIGVITSLLAVLTGNQAFSIAKHIISINKQLFLLNIIEKHESYATLTLWLFLVVLALKFYFIVKRKTEIKFQIILISIAFIGCYLVIMTAVFGGILVYEHGIGTILYGK